MVQGRVYFPGTILPPKQATRHRIVVLTKRTIINTHAHQSRSFVMVALIRSAHHQNGQPVRLMPLHSIPLRVRDHSWLEHDSIVETHQLFHLATQELRDPRNRPLGDLPPHLLEQVLDGAQALFR